MPALYRMPVFYLAATVVVAGLSLRALLPARARTAAIPQPVATPVKPIPVAAPAPEPEPADGILRTAEGLRRKVVVRELDLVPRTEPEGGRPTGKKLDYFSIRYLYDERPGPPRMLAVGPREGVPEGWVPDASVLEWDTRLMARPTPRDGRPKLILYREQSCLLDALAGRTCSKHADRCPTEGEEPDAPAANTAPSAGLPILQSKAIPQADGATRTIFEVASLVQDRAAPPRVVEPSRDSQAALRRVYVAFVVDTTASMSASVQAVRATVERIVQEAARRYADVTLRLALVEYRDRDAQYGFRSRVSAPFTDPASFREAIARIEVSKHRDGSVDESVLDGLKTALPAPQGRPAPAGSTLDWPSGRRGELATKLVILLGDAPDHAREIAPVAAVADEAKAAGITIATVGIDRRDLRNAEEDARYRAQWKTLAERSHRPRDRASGYREPLAPLVLDLSRADDLAGHLQQLIDDRVERARELAALAAAEAEGRLQEYVDSRGLKLDQVYPVLVDVHRGEAEPKARPDPRFAGRKAPSVRRGWIAEKVGERRMVDVEMLMTRAELESLIGELTALQRAAQGSARDLAELVRIGTAAAAGETDFLSADRGNLTFAQHLERRQGLPPSRPDSLLNRSQGDLLQADDTYRKALDARISQAIERLVRRRNDPDWDEPARLLEGMGLVPYEVIDF